MVSIRKHPITNYALIVSSVAIVGAIVSNRACSPQVEPIRTTAPAVVRTECPTPDAGPVIAPPDSRDGRCEPEKGEADTRSPKYDPSCGRCGDGIRQVRTAGEIPTQINVDGGVPADSGLTTPTIVTVDPPSVLPSTRTRGENVIYYQVVAGTVSETAESCPLDFIAADGVCNSNAGSWISPANQMAATIITDGGVVATRPTARTESDGGVTRFVTFSENDPSNAFYYPLDCYRPLSAPPRQREGLPACPAFVVGSDHLSTTAPNADRYRTGVIDQIGRLKNEIRSALAHHGVTPTSSLLLRFSLVIEPNGEVDNVITSAYCDGLQTPCAGARELPSTLNLTANNASITGQAVGAGPCMWEFSVGVPNGTQ